MVRRWGKLCNVLLYSNKQFTAHLHASSHDRSSNFTDRRNAGSLDFAEAFAKAYLHRQTHTPLPVHQHARNLTMSPFPDKATFLASGLEPYTPNPPPTSPSAPDNTSQPLASGPLFHHLNELATPPPTSPTQPDPTPHPTSASDSDQPKDCPICLSPLTSLPAVRIPSCTHTYHYTCLTAWVHRQNTCPICRATLYESGPWLTTTRVLRGGHVTYVRDEEEEAYNPQVVEGVPPIVPWVPLRLRRARDADGGGIWFGAIGTGVRVRGSGRGGNGRGGRGGRRWYG